MQIGDGGRVALAVLDGELIVADALLALTIDVTQARHAAFDAGLDHRVRDRVALSNVRDIERAARGVELIGAALLVFGATEIGDHIIPAPALTAQLAPTIIVGVLTANIEKAIDRRRSAKNLAARPDMLASARAGIGLGGVEPVDLGVLQGLGIANGDVDHQVGHEL